MKTCNKCGETKNFSEFSKCKSKKDGFYSWCKQCCKNRNKEIKSNPIMQLEKEIASSIRIENKFLFQDGKKICGKCKQIFKIDDICQDGRCNECKREITSFWNNRNKEKVKEKAKQYYLKSQDKRKQYAKEYSQKNKETIKKAKDKYTEKNKEIIKEYQKQYRLKKKLEKEQQKLLSK